MNVSSKTETSSPSAKRICSNIGAEISNIDLTQDMTDEQFKFVHDTLMEREVVVFKNQDISTDEFMRFGERFGELSVHPFSPNMPEKPAVIILDNHGKNPPALTDQWHSDETFRPDPPMGTILRSRIVPEVGGDTMFASMTCAYEGLSDRMQHLIYGLEAVHDFIPFRTLFGGDDPEKKAKLRELEDNLPNPTHPVVRVHPVTGRKILNVNPQFTKKIVGMSPEESASVLQFLYDQAKIPEYQLRVKWEPNQITFWDNRSVHHYATHDYFPQRRSMERITISGDLPIGVDAADFKPTPKATGKSMRTEGLKYEEAAVPKRNFERT